MFRFGRKKGKDSGSADTSQPPLSPNHGAEEEKEAQGFLCPMCKAAFQGPLELQNHFEAVHTEGGTASQPPPDTSKPLMTFEDRPTSPDGAEEDTATTKTSDSSVTEVIFLQQELADLAARLKEEIWYTSQLKQELDKVSAERDKVEEEKAMTEEEYSSKLRSAENGFLQVATENEKLKEELKYADYKTQKERDTKLKKEIEALQKELLAKDEVIGRLEEQRTRSASEMSVKDEFLDALKRELEDRPSDSYIKELEIKNKDLEQRLETMERNQSHELQAGQEKWSSKFEDMNKEISSLQLKVKELEIERNAKSEQINSLETAIRTSSESNQQIQENLQDKQQQVVRLQHNVDEVNATMKEKDTFIKYLEKQIEDYKENQNQETLNKQNLQQDLRAKDNQLEEEKRTITAKDEKIQELQSGIERKKEEMERIEAEKGELLQQIEAGEGVQTAIHQLKQEKEKLIDGVAVLEKEMEEQSKRYQSELDQMREGKLKVNEDLQHSRDKVESLENELKQLTEQVNRSRGTIDELRNEVKLKGDQLRQAESDRLTEVGKLEVDIRQKAEVLTSKEQDLTGLRSQHENLLTEASNLRATSTQLEADIRSKTQDLKVCDEKIENLEKQLETKEQKNKEHVASMEKLSTDFRNASEKYKKEILGLSEQIQTHKQQIKEQDDKLNMKDLEIEKIGKELSEVKTQYTECDENRQACKKDLDVALNKIGALEKDLQSSIEERKREKESHEETLAAKENALLSYTEEQKRLYNDLESKLKSEIAQVEQEKQQKESNLSQEMKTSQEKHSNEILELNNKISNLEQESATGRALLDQEKEEKGKLESKLTKVTEERDSILSSLEQKDTILQEVQRQYEIAQQELKKDCEHCKNYERQLCRLEETHSENSETISKLNTEKDELKVEIKGLKEALSYKVDEMEALKLTTNEQQDELNTELNQLKEVKAVLEARVLELDDELKEAFNKYDALKAEQESMRGNLMMQTETLNQTTSDRDKAYQDLSLLEAEMKEREDGWDKEKIKLQELNDSTKQEKDAVDKQLKEMHALLEREKELHQETKTTAEKRQDVMKQEIAALRKKLENADKEKENLTKSTEQLEARHKMHITTINETIEAVKRESSLKDAKIEKLENNIKAFEGEKDDMRGEIAVLEAQVQHLGDEKRALSERILQGEEKLKEKQTKLTEYKQRLDQSLSALQELGTANQNLQIKHNLQLTRQWEDDQLAVSCKACSKQFSMTVRKHHCRHCGSIFCNECSSYNIQVAAAKKPVRCCLNCYSELSRLQGGRSSRMSIS